MWRARAYIIWNYIDWTVTIYYSRNEYFKAIRELSDNTWYQSQFHILLYDADEVNVDKWMDWELYITNREFWEDISDVIYKWKYNPDKAKLFVLDKDYLEFTYRNFNS